MTDEPQADMGLDYYQQRELWDEASGYGNEIEQERAHHLAGLIRDLGARRVLDAGAGNGIVANRLQSAGLDVTALDHSDVAMDLVETPKVVGSVAAMPFEDRAFDLVLASEVLEHLPVHVFDATRRELARVARQWVVITVPNREDLVVSGVVCPSCSCRSSPWRHMRSFSVDYTRELIPGFRPTTLETFGPESVRYTRLEVIVKRELLNRWSWPPATICPQCGYRNSTQAAPPAHPEKRLAAIKGRMLRPLRRQAPKWIIAIFERSSLT